MDSILNRLSVMASLQIYIFIAFTLFYSFGSRADNSVVWVFETDLTGAFNQRLSMAEKFTTSPVILKFPPKDSHLTTVEYLKQLLKDKYGDPTVWPDYIFQTEKRKWETDFLLELRKISPKRTRIIHLENPEYRTSEFDLVTIGIHLPKVDGNNIIRPLGVASWLTKEKVDQERKRIVDSGSKFIDPEVKNVFVSIGGSSHENEYIDSYLDDLALRLKELYQNQKINLFIVTSRRTPKNAMKILEQRLSEVPHFLFDWNTHDLSKNPFLSWISIADFVVVTGDSRSAISDAAITGKPIYIHAPHGSTLLEHDRVIQEYYIRGIARPFTGKRLQTWIYESIDISKTIKLEVMNRFTCQGFYSR